MTTSTVDQIESTSWRDRPSYLASHRARAAGTRELTRLIDGAVQGVAVMHAECDTVKPVIRRSPLRCIVQLGPVALTIAWMRHGSDSMADGELLAIVWRGAVAPRSTWLPEQGAVSATGLSATELWEEVFTVRAEDEASWRWCAAAGLQPYTSAMLVDRCLAQLRRGYEQHCPASHTLTPR